MGRNSDKSEAKRRERPVEATDVYVPESEGEENPNQVFRKRLVYLMNGNNALGKTVNIQELADAVGISRPAIRKYLKPRDHGDATSPSALTVCRIARYFGVTPDFMLGFDSGEKDEQTVRLGYESDFYNALGLNQHTLEKLRALRALQGVRRTGEQAGAMLAMLDRQICSFADDAIAVLEKK